MLLLAFILGSLTAVGAVIACVLVIRMYRRQSKELRRSKNEMSDEQTSMIRLLRSKGNYVHYLQNILRRAGINDYDDETVYHEQEEIRQFNRLMELNAPAIDEWGI